VLARPPASRILWKQSGGKTPASWRTGAAISRWVLPAAQRPGRTRMLGVAHLAGWLVGTLIAACTVGAVDTVPALATPAEVVAWGYNGAGQLGNGTTTSSTLPVLVSGLGSVPEISAGLAHSLARTSSSGVLAWGENISGALGDGTNTNSDVPVGSSLPPGDLAEAISAGGDAEVLGGQTGDGYSLAVLQSGRVAAWGQNTSGQLGNGTGTNSNVPVEVCAVGAAAPCSAGNGNVLEGVRAVSAGGDHSLALLSNGTVVAWGSNGSGELGNGTTTSSQVPVKVNLSLPSGVTVTAISAGLEHSLALLSNGTVRAWGEDLFGELGDGTFTRSINPAAVCAVGAMAPCSEGNGNVLTGASAIAAGADHSIALLGGGSAVAWGDNEQGELGNGSSSPLESNVPLAVALPGGSAATAISTGSLGEFGLALLSNGTVVAWGYNSAGQLGDGTETGPESCFSDACSRTPTPVHGIGGASAISAGWIHSLAIVRSLITLSPQTATDPVGGNHTLTATVSEGGVGVANQTVTFKVISGPNAGATGVAATNSSGQASFTYHDANGPGTDSIEASYTDAEGARLEATATKRWIFPQLWTSSSETTALRSVTSTPIDQPDALEFVNSGPMVIELSNKRAPHACEVEFGVTVLVNNGTAQTKLALPFGIAEGNSCKEGEEIAPTYFDTRANGSVPATITIGGAGPTYTATVHRLKLSQNIGGTFCTETVNNVTGTLTNVTAGFVDEAPPNLTLQITHAPIKISCPASELKVTATLTASFFLETPSTATNTAFVG
jgi:alpha-tubulin suppressor-like RCC1 family protein